MPHTITMLGEVLPGCASHDHSDVVALHAEFSGQLWTTPLFVLCSYLSHLLFCQLCVRVFASFVVFQSSLGCGIAHIVSMRSQKQMLGIPASGIVALVANLAFGRRFFKVKRPRNSMNAHHLSLASNAPVSAFVNVPRPDKAWGGERALSFMRFFMQASKKRRFGKFDPDRSPASIGAFSNLVEKLHLEMVQHSYIRVN